MLKDATIVLIVAKERRHEIQKQKGSARGKDERVPAIDKQYPKFSRHNFFAIGVNSKDEEITLCEIHQQVRPELGSF